MNSRSARSISAPPIALGFFESDLCVKCNICTVACPVAAVTEAFPGPKTVGPQTARFRHPASPVVDAGLGWCSGCGVCSTVCPHQVPVAEMNIIAKSEVPVPLRELVRDWGLSRPEELARWLRPVRIPANWLLRAEWFRALADTIVGLARSAPLPPVAPRSFRSLHPELVTTSLPPAPAPGRVAYFHGCSTNDYEPWIGDAAVRILQGLGLEVVLPPQRCCGLPLQSNRNFVAARKRAAANLESLHPWAEQGIPIVGTSTSCTLALKHEYRAILGFSGSQAEVVAEGTFDIFEYLEQAGFPDDRRLLKPVRLRVLYHAPCQLRSHRIGSPALRLLRTIPELDVVSSLAECCGVAGTYGLKSERYQVARQVGEGLFRQAQEAGVDLVVTDSETCRWWIEKQADLPARHPVEVLAASLGVPLGRPLPPPRSVA